MFMNFKRNKSKSISLDGHARAAEVRRRQFGSKNITLPSGVAHIGQNDAEEAQSESEEEEAIEPGTSASPSTRFSFFKRPSFKKL